ncbi:MAG: UDP-N-acetylglucosamine 2-epimerase [Alphaproteobacteria bacterium]|nr:UDP-N-acetylglucosamine 2-epimerase [Alphaproteobacteria bacterium]
MSRKIAVITATRAEYGLLRWTMREILERGGELQLIATGTHLSAAHGMTLRDIEADGFDVTASIDMKQSGDRPKDIIRAMVRLSQELASLLPKLSPDLLVILGDRYEMLAAASSALMFNLPIAHIHGGEVTEGAMDESIRHAITKLSYWHFATAEPYARRIMQLGEEASRVFIAGAPGIDNISRLPLLPREALTEDLKLALNSPLILLTYHPETLAATSPLMQLEEVLAALESRPDATLIITGANADSGGAAINDRLRAFAEQRPQTVFSPSLGSLRYLSAIRAADVVLGNSSSGMIEAPVLATPTVNIGDRQKGRLRAPSVIDSACERGAISAALAQALLPAFKQGLEPWQALGRPGQVAPMIAEKLLSLEIPARPVKPFVDF